MDPRRAPPRVRLRHRANQRSDIGGQGRSPEAAPTFPPPPQAEAASVPRDDRLRLHDDERGSPSGPEAREQDSKAAVRLREPDSSWSGALQHRQLVPARPGVRGERANVGRVKRRERSTETTGRETYPSRPATSTTATRTYFWGSPLAITTTRVLGSISPSPPHDSIDRPDPEREETAPNRRDPETAQTILEGHRLATPLH